MNTAHSCWTRRFVVHTVFLSAVVSLAATRHVALDGGHVPPFDAWATAATNIQDAVDASSDGDTVLVSNGVYAAGATWAGGWSNRVALAAAIRVEGLGTAPQTVIMGAGIRCLYLTSNAVVCNVTLTNGWRAGDGGGVFIASSGVLSNCIVSGNRAEDYGGGVLLERGGLVTACTLCGNVAEDYGGGVYLDEGGRVEHSCLAANVAEDGTDGSGGGVFVDTTGVVYACTLVTNRARYGAAVFLGSGGQLIRCVLSNNTAVFGGVYSYNGGMLDACDVRNNYASLTAGGLDLSYAHASNCVVLGNQASGGAGIALYRSVFYGGTLADNRAQADGGGASLSSGGVLDRTLVVSNSAGRFGGGIRLGANSEARNCLVYDNSANSAGGVVFYAGGVLYNATVCGNYASNTAGGIRFINAGTNRNSIVYFNTCPYPSSVNMEVQGAPSINQYVCTTPLFAGVGNTNANPLFVDHAARNYELQANSPCRDAGTNMPWMTGALDFGGTARVDDGRVDMGCYEFIPEPGCAAALTMAGILLAITRAHGRRPPDATVGARRAPRRLV